MANCLGSTENDQPSSRHGSIESDERSHLLMPDGSNEPDTCEANPKFSRRNMLLCGGFILLLTLLECSGNLRLVPLNQILEGIICRHQYPERDTDCSNSEAVQAELALLKGWQNTIDVIPSMCRNFWKRFIQVFES